MAHFRITPRLLPGVLLLVAALILFRGRDVSKAESASSEWNVGFWVWDRGRESGGGYGGVVDTLYCEAGSIQHETMFGSNRWMAYASLPEGLPPAREYWAVLRFEDRGVPAVEVAPRIVEAMTDVRRQAVRRGLPLRGLQLDIDSPTGSLDEYAKLLRAVKQGLGPGMELSITALLDWFRDGTAVGDVVNEVDEFVPQFYDVQDRRRNPGSGDIAANVDAARWGPRFNRFGKRFRVGLSTFGRSRVVRQEPGSRGTHLRIGIQDVRLLQIATRPEFTLRTSRTEAGDLVLSYRSSRRGRIGFSDYDAGDTFEFTLATPEGIRRAVEQVRRMARKCGGVLFFRWPQNSESLTMPPAEVLRAAAGSVSSETKARVIASDGRCVAVHCVDLFAEVEGPLVDRPLQYEISSTEEMEYFLPAKEVPVRMAAPMKIGLTLPPYCGRGRIYLGRAVSKVRAEYGVEGR